MRRATLAALLVLLWSAHALAQPEAPPAPSQPDSPPAAPPVGPPATCSAVTFRDEVLARAPYTNLCPKRSDPLLATQRKRFEDAVVVDNALLFDVLRVLRTAAEQGKPDWSAALARNIDRALKEAKAGKAPNVRFSAARNPLPREPGDCLFITGDAWAADYACYVSPGKAGPTRAAGDPPLATYALASFEEAYQAYAMLELVNKAFLQFAVAELDKASARLSQAQKRWDNLTKKGYLQYPWEIAVMGAQDDYDACFKHDRLCTGEEGLDPNQWRWILAHPGVGIGLQGFGANGAPSADAALSISLEAIGFTKYDESFSFYWGLSAGAVVNDGDFGDIRPGVFAHVSRWVHVGYLVSLMDDSTRWDATLFLSADVGTALGATFFE